MRVSSRWSADLAPVEVGHAWVQERRRFVRYVKLFQQCVLRSCRAAIRCFSL